SGRSEIVLTGFGSGNGEAGAGDGAGVMMTTGVSTIPRTTGPPAGLAAALGAGDGGCAVWAFRSTGCSSLLTTFTRSAWVLSLRRDAPASLEVETVASLGGCTLVGPTAAAMKGGTFESPGRPP